MTDVSGWERLDDALAYGGRLLTGERVRLRATTDDDLTVLDAWWNDPQLSVLNTRTIRPRTPGGHVETMRGWSENALDGRAVGFSVVTLDSDEFAGHVGLFAISAKERSATFGIVLGPPFWSRGLGTDTTRVMVRYGFAELGLNRVELKVWAFNERAVAVYQRAGFEIEGRHRESVFHDGRWHDEYTMAQLARDWQARPG